MGKTHLEEKVFTKLTPKKRGGRLQAPQYPHPLFFSLSLVNRFAHVVEFAGSLACHFTHQKEALHG
jgi:hypothetical protein